MGFFGRIGTSAGWLGAVVLLTSSAVRSPEDCADGAGARRTEPIAKLIALEHRDPRSVCQVLEALPVQLSPDDQTNRLLVIGRPEAIEQIERLVAELDVPVRTGRRPDLELRIYRLRSRQARDLIPCLSPMLSERGRICADAETQTVVVKDEPAIHSDLAVIVRELDAAPAVTSAEADAASSTSVPAEWPVAKSPHGDAALAAAIAAGEEPTPDRAAVQLQLTVCRLNRELLDRLGNELTAVADSPLFFHVRHRTGLGSVFDSNDAALCLDSLASCGAVEILSSPKLVLQSGQSASFLSAQRLRDPVVIEDETATTTAVVDGLDVDLECVPTVLGPNHVHMQLTSFWNLSPPNAAGLGETESPRPTFVPIELCDGEVFAVSGKVRSRNTSPSPPGALNKLLSGVLRSKRPTDTESELIVLVSPVVLQPPRLAEVVQQDGHGRAESKRWR